MPSRWTDWRRKWDGLTSFVLRVFLQLALLLPECVTYSQETSTGLKRLWEHEIELS